MNFEAYFNFVFILVVIYVIFGNYLYFKKIIPALNTAPGLLPSTQFKHMQLYLDMLQERGERPWFLFLFEKHKSNNISDRSINGSKFFAYFRINMNLKASNKAGEPDEKKPRRLTL